MKSNSNIIRRDYFNLVGLNIILCNLKNNELSKLQRESGQYIYFSLITFI